MSSSPSNADAPEGYPTLGSSSVAPGTPSAMAPADSPPRLHYRQPSRRHAQSRRLALAAAQHAVDHQAPEAVVFSLLEQMPPELLQYMCNFLPSLNDIYNMRRVFKAAMRVDNELFRRAIFNRAALSCINAEAWHKDDPVAKDLKCSICSSRLPPVHDFHVIGRCNFPYCLTECAIRPSPPLPKLTPPIHGIPDLMIRPGRVGLTLRRGPVIHGASVLLKWRQFDKDDKNTGPWTIQYGGYRHSHANILVTPGTLDTTKLTQFAYAVRVNVCTCPFVDGLPVPSSACYMNHKKGRKCAAVWTPWSLPSIPIYVPNQEETEIFKRRMAFMQRAHDEAETVVVSSGSGSDSHADSGED